MRTHITLIALFFSFFIVGCGSSPSDQEVPSEVPASENMEDRMVDIATDVPTGTHKGTLVGAFSCVVTHDRLTVPVGETWSFSDGDETVYLQEGDQVDACQAWSNDPTTDTFRLVK